MHRRNQSGARARDPRTTLKRLIKYIFGQHWLLFVFVAVCLTLNSASNSVFSIFLKTLIDDYIEPMLGGASLMRELTIALLQLAGFLLIGILAGYFYNRTMAVISQSVLKQIRNDMFAHMQKLPLKYFDTNTHGDIMSHYTNDTDTLRQMIAQSIPQLCRSIISIVIVLTSMIIMNPLLTVICLAFNALKLLVSGKIAGKSRGYFISRQRALGDVNGYIEEMVNGQKVVQVFCHEEKAKEVFIFQIFSEFTTKLLNNYVKKF